MTKGFRVFDAIGESLRNLRSNLVVSAVVVLLCVGAGFAAMTASIDELRRISSHADTLSERGVNVLMVTVPGGYRADRCESLPHVSGIEKAGARLATVTYRIDAPVSRAATVRLVTAGYIDTMWPGLLPPTDGYIIGHTLASQLGLEAGSRIAVTPSGGEATIIRIAAVAPETTRDANVNHALVRVTSPLAQAQQCLVAVAPGAVEGAAAMLTSRFSADEAHVAPLFVADSTVPDPTAQLASRISLHTPWAAGVLCVVTLVGFWAMRARDFALYRLLQMRRGRLLIVLSAETAVLALVPTVAGSIIALIHQPILDPRILDMVALGAAQTFTIVLLAPPLGLLLVGIRKPSRVLLGQVG